MTKAERTYIALGLNIAFYIITFGLIQLGNVLNMRWLGIYVEYGLLVFIPLVYVIASINLFTDKNSRPLQFILWVILLMVNLFYVTWGVGAVFK